MLTEPAAAGELASPVVDAIDTPVSVKLLGPSSASTSVSLAKASIVTGAPGNVDATSAAATGLSFTPSTVTVTSAESVKPSESSIW